ncbi:MAG: hypothetical protein U1D30_05130 [Planctomycetota bacterium]
MQDVEDMPPAAASARPCVRYDRPTRSYDGALNTWPNEPDVGVKGTRKSDFVALEPGWPGNSAHRR